MGIAGVRPEWCLRRRYGEVEAGDSILARFSWVWLTSACALGNALDSTKL